MTQQETKPKKKFNMKYFLIIFIVFFLIKKNWMPVEIKKENRIYNKINENEELELKIYLVDKSNHLELIKEYKFKYNNSKENNLSYSFKRNFKDYKSKGYVYLEIKSNNININANSKIIKYIGKKNKEISYKNNFYFQLLKESNYIDLTNLSYNSNNSNNKNFTPHFIMDTFWERDTEDFIKESKIIDKDEITVNIEFFLTRSYYFTYQLGFSQLESEKVYGELNIMNDLKSLFLDNSEFYLIIFFLVNFLHTIFSTMTVTNDFYFFKNIKSNKGISLRQISLEAFCEFIWFLYLLDNNTSYLILLFSFLELLMNIYKIYMLLSFKINLKFPFIHIEYPKNAHKETIEFDQKSTQVLIKFILPLLLIYSTYNYFYNEHKNFYSFALTSLTSFIYATRFINMFPQVYINYKLKSVEHMPWKSMIFRFLNTIVDDLFAFAVKMPMLKRLSMFCDDVVFVIYIYQRYIYRVDKNRDEDGNKIGEKKEKVE